MTVMLRCAPGDNDQSLFIVEDEVKISDHYRISIVQLSPLSIGQFFNGHGGRRFLPISVSTIVLGLMPLIVLDGSEAI